jgi:hypothetical protein
MSFHLPNFLRFRARAPKKGPPPKNFVDAYYDPDQGKIIAVNDENVEVEFKGAGETGAHTHVSADITDATSDGQSNQGKLLKSLSGILPPGEHGGVYLTHVTLPLSAGSTSRVRIDYNRVHRGPHLMDWPVASGTIACLPQFANSTSANLSVSVGDVWWDSTLNKARVRLV